MRYIMDLNRMIEAVKTNPAFRNVGMIASHIGIVRSFSRDGKTVVEFDVEFDSRTVAKIARDIKSLPGIVEVLIETNSGRLKVGDEIMALVVAGDIRENVLSALTDTISRLKSEAATKNEVTV
jgi:molybdopterin synthase catalytic subunit